MTKETKLPAIPNSTDPSVKALKEALEVRLGRRGDPLDRAATIRELYNGGVLNVTGLPLVGGGGGGGVGSLTPTVNTPTLNMSVPQAPTNLTATGAFVGILLTWDRPIRRDLTTHIYRSDEDDLATAVFVGLSPGHIYSDLVGHGKTHYYWVRYVSEADITGPYNAIAGTEGITAIPVSQIIADLNDALDTSHLSTTLRTEIAKIAINGTSITDEASARVSAVTGEATARASALTAEAAARVAAINAEILARENGEGALQGSIDVLATAATALGTAVSGNAEAIDALVISVEENEGGITANSSDITSLETTVNDTVTGVGATSTALSTLASTVATQGTAITTSSNDITSLETTVNDAITGVGATSTALGTLESTVTTQGTATTTNASDISALKTTVNDADTGVGATSTALGTLESTVTTQGTTITTNASDITALETTVNDPTTGVGAQAAAISTLTSAVTTQGTAVTTNASDITALETTVNDTVTGVGAQAAAISTLTSTITTQGTAVSTNASDITALETTVNNPTTGVGAQASAISTLTSTVNSSASTVSALSTATTALSTEVGGFTSAIAVNATSVNGLRAEYTVKIDNGKVSGYGLAGGAGCLINGLFDDSVSQGACSGAGGTWVTDSSEFAVNADTFRISSPSGDMTPFQVVTGAGMCIFNNGGSQTGVAEATCLANPEHRQWVPAGVYMTQASMISAYIDGAHVNNLTMDFANVTGTLSGNKIDVATLEGNRIVAGATLDAPVITAGASITSPLITSATINGGTITGVLVRSGAVALLTDHGNPHYGYDSGVVSDVSGSGTSGITSAQLNIRPFNFHQTAPPSPHVKNPASNLWRYRSSYVTPEVSGSVALTRVGGLINSNYHSNIRHCQIQIAIKQSPNGATTSTATFDITSFNSGDDETKTRVLTAYTGYYNYTLSYQYRTETGSNGFTTFYYHRIESQTLTFTATPRVQGVSFNSNTSAGYYAEVQVLNVDGNFCSVGARTIRIQDTADNAY